MAGGIGSRRAFEDARYYMTRASILNKMKTYDMVLIKAGEGWDYAGGGSYHSNVFELAVDLGDSDGAVPALFISIWSDLGISVRFINDANDEQFTLGPNEHFILDRWEFEFTRLKVRSLQASGGADTKLRIMVLGFQGGTREKQVD